VYRASRVSAPFFHWGPDQGKEERKKERKKESSPHLRGVGLELPDVMVNTMWQRLNRIDRHGHFESTLTQHVNVAA
jgi:hypothetical protein